MPDDTCHAAALRIISTAGGDSAPLVESANMRVRNLRRVTRAHRRERTKHMHRHGVLCTCALLGRRRHLAQVGRNAKNMNSTTRDVKWHPSTLNPINRWRQGSGLCPTPRLTLSLAPCRVPAVHRDGCDQRRRRHLEPRASRRLEDRCGSLRHRTALWQRGGP